MKIKVLTLHVDDQDKALRFYTEVLGFTKKADFSQGPYRWLTVADAGGMELQLAKADSPAAKAWQTAQFEQKQPALMLFTDDLAGELAGIEKRGADVVMPLTDVTASKIAQVKDGCGNLVQLTQLVQWS